MEVVDVDDGAHPWTPVEGSAFPHDHIVPGASERFKCSICLQVMKEPVSIVPCGHMFDEACIEKHRASRPSARCPRGCNTVIERWVKSPDMRQHIRESVRARCRHDACESVMAIDELPAHARVCIYRRFRCSLPASDGGVCGAEATLAEQQSHEDTCPHVVVPCEHRWCMKRTRRGSLRDHMATCDRRPVVCKCGLTYSFLAFCKHKAACLEELEPCHICSVHVTRRAMQAHMEDPSQMRAHINFLFAEFGRGIRQLKEENEGLKHANAELERRVASLEMLNSPGAALAQSHV